MNMDNFFFDFLASYSSVAASFFPHLPPCHRLLAPPPGISCAAASEQTAAPSRYLSLLPTGHAWYCLHGYSRVVVVAAGQRKQGRRLRKCCYVLEFVTRVAIVPASGQVSDGERGSVQAGKKKERKRLGTFLKICYKFVRLIKFRCRSPVRVRMQELWAEIQLTGRTILVMSTQLD